MSERKLPPSRQYPPIFEKTIPFLLALILVVMIVLLVVAIGVATGWIG